MWRQLKVVITPYRCYQDNVLLRRTSAQLMFTHSIFGVVLSSWGYDDDFDHEAFKTVDDLKKPFRSDIEITDSLPGQESYMGGDYWDPTHLRIYKLEDFELKLDEHKGEYFDLSYEPYSLSYLDLSKKAS